MYVCMYVCMHACMHVCVYVCVCMYVCTYVRTYACMCIYIYIYAYMHTYIHLMDWEDFGLPGRNKKPNRTGRTEPNRTEPRRVWKTQAEPRLLWSIPTLKSRTWTMLEPNSEMNTICTCIYIIYIHISLSLYIYIYIHICIYIYIYVSWRYNTYHNMKNTGRAEPLDINKGHFEYTCTHQRFYRLPDAIAQRAGDLRAAP